MRTQRTELRAQPPADHAPAWRAGRLKRRILRHRGLLALDQRYLFALPNITVGRVTREIVPSCEQIAVEYDGLADDQGVSSRRASASRRCSEDRRRAGLRRRGPGEALQEPEQARAYFRGGGGRLHAGGGDREARRLPHGAGRFRASTARASRRRTSARKARRAGACLGTTRDPQEARPMTAHTACSTAAGSSARPTC